MALYPFKTETYLKPSWLANNFGVTLRFGILNHIRDLINNSVVYSAGLIDCWGEAYVDSNGRNNSVDTGSTTSIFDTNIYTAQLLNDISGETDNDPDSFSNPSNAFDNDDSTYASKSKSWSRYDDGTVNYELGKTFSATTVNKVKIVAQLTGYAGNNGASWDVKLQTYDGSTWTDDTTLGSGSMRGSGSFTAVNINGIYDIGSSIQGVRIAFKLTMYSTGSVINATMTGIVYTLTTIDTSAEAQIYHTIPTGTFPSTISSAIGVPLIEDWEDGANIQYKLTNTGGEDTGWLDCMDSKPEISSFTAFTSEPTTLIVKLTPKTTSPTAGYPSIKGFGIYAE